MAANLPANSSITVDGVTIHANASVVMLWEHVIRRSIQAGHAAWIRLGVDDGQVAVLVQPGTSVQSFISMADLPEGSPKPFSDHSSNSNLVAWVDEHVDRDDSLWEFVTMLGIDKDIVAAPTEPDGDVLNTIG